MHLSGHVHDVIIFKTTHDVSNCVSFPDMAQKLVAKPFALGRAGNQARNIHELHRGGYDLERIYDLR